MKGAFHEAELLNRNHPQEKADSWFTIGLAYGNTRQPDKVQEVYQRLRKLDPAIAERLRDAAVH